jgi:adenosylhomocysteine nucleosidase
VAPDRSLGALLAGPLRRPLGRLLLAKGALLLLGLAAAPQAPVVVLVSADAEWRALRAVLDQPREEQTPLGETFSRAYGTPRGSVSVPFLHAGWGKVSSAAAAQYAVDRWRPRLLVNLGTCGGFSGAIEKGAVLLVKDTLLYDIHERMGDSQEALDHYTTQLDPELWPRGQRAGLRIERLVSADRDIDPAEIALLVRRFGAVAADWETAAIAFVAARNKTPLVVLRGVSDLVSPQGGEAYGNLEQFEAGSRRIMGELLRRFDAALPELVRR